MASGSRCLCNCWPMLSGCLSKQASSKLIQTPSRHPQAHADGSLFFQATLPSGPSAVGTQTRSPAYTLPHETLCTNEKGWQSDRDYSLVCINCVLFLFLMKESWRLGGQVEQSHKTNPIIQERFVPLSDSPYLSHSVFCGIISQLRFREHRHLFLVAPNPFLLYFAHAVAATHGGGVYFYPGWTTCNLPN